VTIHTPRSSKEPTVAGTLDTHLTDPPIRFERSTGVLTVFVTGDFDLVGAPRAAALVDSERRAGDDVVVDMTLASFCDSSGIRALFSMHLQATEGGGRFAVRNPSRPVRRVLEICDPGGVLEIVDDSDVSAID
jgi:anti-anti-sigma factor